MALQSFYTAGSPCADPPPAIQLVKCPCPLYCRTKPYQCRFLALPCFLWLKSQQNIAYFPNSQVVGRVLSVQLRWKRIREGQSPFSPYTHRSALLWLYTQYSMRGWRPSESLPSVPRSQTLQCGALQHVPYLSSMSNGLSLKLQQRECSLPRCCGLSLQRVLNLHCFPPPRAIPVPLPFSVFLN